MPILSIASAELKALRERAGLSVREMAEALERPLASYSTYENNYKKNYVPADLVVRIANVVTGRGDPPIKRDEVMKLQGVISEPLFSSEKDSKDYTLLFLEAKSSPPIRPTPGARMRVTIELLGRTVDDVAAEMHIPVDELRAALDAPGPPEPALLALFCEITQVGRAWVTRGDVEAVSRYMAASLGFLHPEMVSGLIDQKERRRGKASEAGET